MASWTFTHTDLAFYTCIVAGIAMVLIIITASTVAAAGTPFASIPFRICDAAVGQDAGSVIFKTLAAHTVLTRGADVAVRLAGHTTIVAGTDEVTVTVVVLRTGLTLPIRNTVIESITTARTVCVILTARAGIPLGITHAAVATALSITPTAT